MTCGKPGATPASQSNRTGTDLKLTSRVHPDDAEEYTQALGQVVSGGWRQVALGVRLGIPAALGLTTREWVEGRLGGYVRLGMPERREAVAELTSGDESLSGRETAAVLGVAEGTIRNDRAAQNYALAEPDPPETLPSETPTSQNYAPSPEEERARERARDYQENLDRREKRLEKLAVGWCEVPYLAAEVPHTRELLARLTNGDRVTVLEIVDMYRRDEAATCDTAGAVGGAE